MNAVPTTQCGGASLIEVMLAVALTAVTALGLIATQLWIARETRAAALREHAAFVVDAIVEAARVPTGSDTGVRQWSARAANLLPRGEATIGERGDGVSFARVTWTAITSMPSLRAPGEGGDKAESCGDPAVGAGVACVTVAFVK
jgi:Tfp pilus assembly protein PilV